MNSLEKPDDKVEDVFKECISNIRDKTYKSELESITDKVKKYTDDYEEKMKKGDVHLFPTHTKIDKLEAKDLIKVYEGKMAHKGQPGRKYYDKYLSIPQYGLCPYCGIGYVSTLDHFLPKTKYISLVVTPLNLVPVCFDCNKKKTDEIFTKKEDVLINPYFDDLGDNIWLKATIVEQDEFIMNYTVIKPEEWDDMLFKRVSKQFEVLKLNTLYSVHAAQRLSIIKKRMINIYTKRGEKSMMLDLQENLDCFDEDPNNWEAAMYRELIDNDWIRNEWIKTKCEI